MGKIKVTPCDIKGLYVIEPAVLRMREAIYGDLQSE